jgi:hypothetical protein
VVDLPPTRAIRVAPAGKTRIAQARSSKPRASFWLIYRAAVRGDENGRHFFTNASHSLTIFDSLPWSRYCGLAPRGPRAAAQRKDAGNPSPSAPTTTKPCGSRVSTTALKRESAQAAQTQSGPAQSRASLRHSWGGDQPLQACCRSAGLLFFRSPHASVRKGLVACARTMRAPIAPPRCASL